MCLFIYVFVKKILILGGQLHQVFFLEAHLKIQVHKIRHKTLHFFCLYNLLKAMALLLHLRPVLRPFIDLYMTDLGQGLSQVTIATAARIWIGLRHALQMVYHSQ